MSWSWCQPDISKSHNRIFWEIGYLQNRIIQSIGLSDFRGLKRILAKDSASPCPDANRRFQLQLNRIFPETGISGCQPDLRNEDQALTTNRIIRFKFEPEYPGCVFCSNGYIYCVAVYSPHLSSPKGQLVQALNAIEDQLLDLTKSQIPLISSTQTCWFLEEIGRASCRERVCLYV